MCGIAGVVSADPGDAAAVDRMVAAMRHRGPDDRGVHRGDGATLGATRLAIFDLSPAGHQPMTTPDGRFTIAYNGEVYNWRALKRELIDLGHAFRSEADTEVVLHAFAAWGEACLDRLRGMFAFAIWDAAERRLL